MSSNTLPKPVEILLVEDDEIDAEAMKRVLKKSSITYSLHHAFDSIKALEMLRNQAISQPYIMLIDINMPMMNGLELLQELRNDNALKQSIVFIVTTSKRKEDKAAAYDLNAAGYILKENLPELAEMLGAYCSINQFPEAACAAWEKH